MNVEYLDSIISRFNEEWNNTEPDLMRAFQILGEAKNEIYSGVIRLFAKGEKIKRKGINVEIEPWSLHERRPQFRIGLIPTIIKSKDYDRIEKFISGYNLPFPVNIGYLEHDTGEIQQRRVG